MGGLHGLVNDGQQLAGQGIQVDLLPQPDAEVIDRGRRHRQGGAVLAQHLPNDHYRAGIAHTQDSPYTSVR